MLASALRRLGLLTTLGLAIWLIGKFRADHRVPMATPWPQVPTDEPGPAPAAAAAEAPAPVAPPTEETAPKPRVRAQNVALRRPGQVISLPVPPAEQLLLTAAEPQPEAPAGPAWLEPVDGACPPGYPVKAKLSSHLYHEQGMLAYKRTHPDRCYINSAAAERDGFVRAKR
jgi:hypothetical protein